MIKGAGAELAAAWVPVLVERSVVVVGAWLAALLSGTPGLALVSEEEDWVAELGAFVDLLQPASAKQKTKMLRTRECFAIIWCLPAPTETGANAMPLAKMQ
jgi:hypothetical protein